MHVSPNPSRKGVVYDNSGNGQTSVCFSRPHRGRVAVCVPSEEAQASFPECTYMRISSVIRMGFFCFYQRKMMNQIGIFEITRMLNAGSY